MKNAPRYEMRVQITANLCTFHINRLAPLGFFCGTSSRHSSFSIQLLSIPQNCVHFYHRRTGTSSRWMFEKIGAARVRRLQACVAGKGFSSRTDMTDRIVPLNDTSLTRHLTLHGTVHRYRQDNTCRKNPKMGRWAQICCLTQVNENTVQK